MNRKLLLISISFVTLCSCSSVYKSGQTPDDVYFSPVRTGYDETRRDDDKSRDETTRYQTSEDRQIRMGINNRRWRSIDNYYYDYSYSPYNYGYNYSYYYNPFYCQTPVYNPVVVVVNNPKNTTPRKVNLGGYGTGYNNTNTAVSPKYNTKYSSRPAYNNRNSGLGSVLSKVFSSGSTNNNSNSNSSSNSTNRSYTPSSSSNSSGGSKSPSSGGSVSRPVKNGKG